MDVLDRVVLQGEQWERISQHIIGDGRTRGLSGGQIREHLNPRMRSADKAMSKRKGLLRSRSCGSVVQFPPRRDGRIMFAAFME
ncbi:hypothetical protein [Neorhizobium galegae]|uniref:hypothetical protein n=1 Tax=Neorhizobium galegae TaxID=399 RepID=UPI0009BB9E8C